MKIFDISMDIHRDMLVWKNKDEKRPLIEVTRDFASGSAYESRISMDMHTGTHIDAPLHMIENGATMESYSLESFVGKCRVLDLTEVEDRITAVDLEDKTMDKGDFIILKTRNSFREDFDMNFVFVEKSGAQYLKDKGVVGVGIDSVGIERSQEGHETHRKLLGSGIAILEGLRLKDVPEGQYFLCALPLKIKGVEAAPARAILIEQ
jgi:arylformamidase